MTNCARRTRLSVALAASTVLALAAGATPAVAAGNDMRYAALGDSYSSGVGAPPYSDGDCKQSKLSYPGQYVRTNHLASFTFLACSGATTQDVLNTQISALPSTSTLVTITVGGDDLGFTSTLETCLLRSDEACRDALAEATDIIDKDLPSRLADVYTAIRAKAPRARLVVLGYPQLFETAEFCLEAPMEKKRREWINAVAAHLNETIEAVATRLATFVPVDELFAHHRLCASDSWLNGIVHLEDAFHPTETGYRGGYLAALQKAQVGLVGARR